MPKQQQLCRANPKARCSYIRSTWGLWLFSRYLGCLLHLLQWMRGELKWSKICSSSSKGDWIFFYWFFFYILSGFKICSVILRLKWLRSRIQIKFGLQSERECWIVNRLKMVLKLKELKELCILPVKEFQGVFTSYTVELCLYWLLHCSVAGTWASAGHSECNGRRKRTYCTAEGQLNFLQLNMVKTPILFFSLSNIRQASLRISCSICGQTSTFSS